MAHTSSCNHCECKSLELAQGMGSWWRRRAGGRRLSAAATTCRPAWRMSSLRDFKAHSRRSQNCDMYCTVGPWTGFGARPVTYCIPCFARLNRLQRDKTPASVQGSSGRRIGCTARAQVGSQGYFKKETSASKQGEREVRYEVDLRHLRPTEHVLPRSVKSQWDALFL